MARKPNVSKPSTTTSEPDAVTAPEPTTSEPMEPTTSVDATTTSEPTTSVDATTTSEPSAVTAGASEPEPTTSVDAVAALVDTFHQRAIAALRLAADDDTGTIPVGALNDAVSAYGAIRSGDRADAVGTLAETIMERCSLDDADADALPAACMASFRRLRTALLDAPRTTSKPEPTSAERAAMLGNRAAIVLGFGFALRSAAIALDRSAGRVAVPSDAQSLADAMERGSVRGPLVDALNALLSTSKRTAGTSTSKRGSGSGAPLAPAVAQAMLALGLDDDGNPRPVLVSAIVKHAGLASSGAVTNRVRGCEPDSKHKPLDGIVSHYAPSGARDSVLHALIADVDAVRALAGASAPDDADADDDAALDADDDA